MKPVLFGASHCYVIQGGDMAQRYLKRLEVMDRHPDTGMMMEPAANATYLQLYTAEDELLYDRDAIVAEAEKQGNIINLDA